MDVITYIIGILILFTIAFVVSRYNNKVASKKLESVYINSGEKPFEIVNKPCSLKKIKQNTVHFERKHFRKCSLYLFNDYILIQDIDDILFKSVISTFVLTKQNHPTKEAWNAGNVYRLLAVELATGKTEIKLMYQTFDINNATHSLIISNLATEEFEHLKIIKDWI